MANYREIRAQSLSIATAAGITVPRTLPLLDEALSVRPVAEIVARLLSANIAAAVSYGLNRVKAVAWLKQEKLDGALTAAELDFVAADEGNPHVFRTQIEGMWALAWAIGMVPSLDFWKDCDDQFVSMLPNLKTSQSGADWYRKARIRPLDEIAAACDLAYCLHWAIRQAELAGNVPPTGLKTYVVAERRRGLEWLLSNEPWDSISLDT